MSPQPLVSVCIPCYNGGKFISNTLRSLTNQTFGDFQAIVVDDASSDTTVNQIRAQTDSRIKLVQNDSNLGLAQNWRKALSFATGKYVKLLCQDDLLYPECLGRQVKTLENNRHSGVFLTLCDRDVIDADDKIVLRRRLPRPKGRIGGATLMRTSLRWGTNIIGEPVVGLFRREALDRVESLDPANPYLIDLALWAEILKHGDAFVDTERLAAFRISVGAATARIGAQQARYFRLFLRAMRLDSFYRASAFDLIGGYVFSFQWALLRNVFITLNGGLRSC